MKGWPKRVLVERLGRPPLIHGFMALLTLRGARVVSLAHYGNVSKTRPSRKSHQARPRDPYEIQKSPTDHQITPKTYNERLNIESQNSRVGTGP